MTESKVMLCEYCEGLGTRVHEVCTNFHTSDYDRTEVVCDRCDGLGRIMKVTTVEWRKLKK